ncbi:MAG: hypothetical protein K8H88_29550, partial [Sandaracinaceae bacterium]|nr:hypothetical protein [Sandaracinaceae bacterium]
MSILDEGFEPGIHVGGAKVGTTPATCLLLRRELVGRIERRQLDDGRGIHAESIEDRAFALGIDASSGQHVASVEGNPRAGSPWGTGGGVEIAFVFGEELPRHCHVGRLAPKQVFGAYQLQPLLVQELPGERVEASDDAPDLLGAVLGRNDGEVLEDDGPRRRITDRPTESPKPRK